jgi:NAD(P)-dependent dehydrogenase (short-subunit alcohol dehydrogenase family)
MTQALAIITGGETGIGYCIAQGLARAGFRIVIACRSGPLAQTGLERLRAEFPATPIEERRLDLADLDSVRAFVAEASRELGRIDVLVNNAGIAWAPQKRSAQGFEMHLATNYLGAFALTRGLAPLLESTPGARVVNMISHAHHQGTIDLQDMSWERTAYNPQLAYARSKLAMLMFTLELDRRLKAARSGCKAIACHPGFSATNIAYNSGMNMLQNWAGRIAVRLSPYFLQSPEQAALPALYAATQAHLRGGEYIGPQRMFGISGPPGPARISRRALDQDLSAKLWAWSEQAITSG